MAQEITTVLKVISVTGDAEKGQENLARSIDRTSGTIDQLIKRLEAERDRIGRSAHEYDLYRAKMAGATKEQLQHIAAIQKQISAEQAHTASMRGVNQQFRFMRGGLGQVGHQIQDIAVQLQMGTNAMLVFGQQGAQIVSLFGPGGAMVGAVLAVVAAFSTYLMASKDAKIGTEELESSADSLIAKFDKLSAAGKRAAKDAMYVKVAELNSENEKLETTLKNVTDKMKILELQGDSSSTSWGKLVKEQVLARAAIQANQQSLKELNDTMSGGGSELKRQLEFIDALHDEEVYLDRQREKSTANADKRAKAEIARQKKIATAQRNLELNNLMVKAPKRRDPYDDGFFNQVANQYSGIEDEYKSQLELAEDHYSAQLDLVQRYGSLIGKSEKDTAKLVTNIQRASSEARRAIMLNDASMVTGIMGQQVDQLAGFFDQTTAIGKAFYAVSQAIAAADAIIKGYQAGMALKAAVAPTDPTGAMGDMLYASSVAMGYATAGAIVGQTIASFEGGGITFDGIRAGGVDGKGGRMAVVHPNEKITDMTKSGDSGGAVNVNFTIVANDTRGFNDLLQANRGQIVNIIRQAQTNRGRSF